MTTGLHAWSRIHHRFARVVVRGWCHHLGNLIGLNILFVGDDWLLSKKNSLVGCMLVAVGWSFSVAGRQAAR